MKQYKKLFKMQYMYYLVIGMFLIIPIIGLLNNFQNQKIINFYDVYIRTINGYWNSSVSQRVGEELVSQIVGETISSIYYLNWIIIIGLFIINMLRAVNRINRRTIDFVAVLPVTRIASTIFDLSMDSIFVIFLYGVMYFFERMYIFQHELFRVYSQELVLGINRIMVLLILSDILIVTIFKLLDVVTTNGMVACFIAIFNYFSLNSILVGILGEFNKFLYNVSNSLFFPLNEYWQGDEEFGYVINSVYSIRTNKFFEMIITLLIVIIILILITIYYSKKIDYSRGGLFYFDLPRYVNIVIIAILMLVYTSSVLFASYYNIFLKISVLIACIVGILAINYFISPSKIKNKIA